MAVAGQNIAEAADGFNKRGNALRERGEHAAALESYEQALALDADHAAALYNRGNVLLMLQRPADALSSFDRVLALNPGDAEALCNRGNALLDLNRLDDALRSYEQALAIEPDYAAALYNRGNALLALKRPEEALGSYDRALGLAPELAEAHSNRGLALHELKRFEEALASYDAALALRPDDAAALYNRGNALLSLERPTDAVACYDAALQLEADHADALHNRGNALRDLKHFQEAIASYDRSLVLRPHHEAFSNRGVALLELHRKHEALVSFEQALALDPDSTTALNNHATVLSYLGRHEEAAKEINRALELDADLPFASGMLLRSKLHCAAWSDLQASAAKIVTAVRAGQSSAAPFDFMALSDSAEDQLRCASIWVKEQCPATVAPRWNGPRYAHDRIRLAYISSDLHEHAVAYLIAGLFERHDKSRFDVTAISLGPSVTTEMSIRLKNAFERFVDVTRTSDAEVAELIRELEIDIAIDLNGFTVNGRTRIFAARAAPIQVNYLGFPGTMGAEYIDYIIADRFVIPAEQHRHYAEKIVNLPDSFQVNDDKRRIAERTPTRAELGLPAQGLVFCSFNNNYKITPRMFDIWMRLLSEVEGSVLWLLGDKSAIEGNLRREAAARGVAAERLVFARRLGYADYLARYRVADLFLDTLPFNAGTTASDALWAGLPVLTCAGEVFAGRMAGSLLRAVGVPELITHSLAEYEEVALTLARDPARLTAIRQKLARNRDTFPLFDTDRFRRHIEAAYVAMWERYQRGEPPARIDVAAGS